MANHLCSVTISETTRIRQFKSIACPIKDLLQNSIISCMLVAFVKNSIAHSCSSPLDSTISSNLKSQSTPRPMSLNAFYFSKIGKALLGSLFQLTSTKGVWSSQYTLLNASKFHAYYNLAFEFYRPPTASTLLVSSWCTTTFVSVPSVALPHI